MTRTLLRLLGPSVALLAQAGCVDATPAANLAARAVAEAKAMPPGRYRDVTLREVSRNLRYADRDRAIEAAAAMSEDDELRSFRPASPPPRAAIAPPDNACERFVAALTPGGARAADERRIRECFAMDAPPGIVPPPIPPFRLLLIAADALSPGAMAAQLLYMATWDAVPERPAGGAREAVRRLRVLLPRLDEKTRRQAAGWLDTTAVDLIEGRPDDAIARVRRAFPRRPAPDVSLADEPATQAQGLIADFLSA